MAYRSHQAGVSILGPVEYGNALIHRARNEVLSQVTPDVSHVLMVDDDMVPEPDAILKFLAHDMPIVSALCVSREPPPRLVLKAYNEASGQFAPMTAMKPKVHVGKFGIGAAFLLIKREVIEALIEDHLSAADWKEDHRRMCDRMHVRTEARDKEQQRRSELRRARWESEKAARVFDFPIGDDDLQYGEDIGLSRKLIRMGIPIAIDATVQVGHLGDKAYYPDDIDYAVELAS